MTVWSQQVIHTRPLLSAGGNLPHRQWSRAPDALPPPLLGEELTRLVSSLGRSRPLLISTASGHRPSTTSSFFILLFHFSYFFFSSSQFTVNCQLFVSRSFFSYSWTTYKFSVELFLCSLKNLETFHINFASSINSVFWFFFCISKYIFPSSFSFFTLSVLFPYRSTGFALFIFLLLCSLWSRVFLSSLNRHFIPPPGPRPPSDPHGRFADNKHISGIGTSPGVSAALD